MHILIVAPEQITVPPILGGSVEICILAIAKKLARSHRVTVVSRAHSRYPRHSVIDGVHIYRVPSGSPMKYLSHVKSFIKGKRFDVIQIDNRPRFVGPLKQLFKGTPVSLFLHSLTFVGAPFTSRATAAKDLAKADIIIANSSSLKQQLSARFPRISGRIRKVWLGVDTNRFSPSRANKPNKAFKVLFTGRLIPRKGVPVLLKAVKQAQSKTVRPIHVVIAGGSTRSGYMESMRALARKLHVNTRFLGTVPHSRIHKVYRQADVFVCPSQQHEAFGLVNVEAMSSGLPVIASSNGGIKEIVRHNKNGILVKDYRKPQAFANAIVRLMNNKNLRNSMKRQARKDCLAKFSWSASAQRLSGVYSKINR
ncbi:glycosyltransferase family 4 protein [Cohnella silvisoli]|uniref:Glycosyltransferase family 4 protein n=1 Tax=Cohnella silvisoli TaxID=2873699 RepID=A0ABV1KTQ9_9BACL|nr:glycosyltransferase family 4 protein [Cohnella silvisoli]MCD9022772.1 glycosyltransferase family 4 protein [Cohnella silvisoli]